MITNDGKEIASKFILGQVPAFATHLSVGCGANPLDGNDVYPNSVYSKKRMDFEMTRVPISSKGFVDDSQTFIVTAKHLWTNVATITLSATHDIAIGETIIVSGVDSTFNGQYSVTDVDYTNKLVKFSRIESNVGAGSNPITQSIAVSPNGACIVSRTKVSLTAELPTANRYEITEVGIWSAGSNNLASLYDSRMIFNFSQNWYKHDSAGIISVPPSNTLGTASSSDIDVSDTVFYAQTNDVLFQNSTRKLRKEGPRHLNTTLLVRGDLSTISPAGGGAWTTTNLKSNWTATGSHIHLSDVNFDISGNNASDILKLAFSIIDKTVTGSNIDDTKIFMEFFKNETSVDNNFAKMQIYVPGAAAGGVQYLNDNKYYIASAELSQNIDYSNYNTGTTLVDTLTKPYIRFYTSSAFSATEIRMCRIYVSVTASAALSQNHYVGLDGFRIDSTVENPVYKMTGYSLVRGDGTPITKLANTNNYIDFRFSLGVS
jgi:hypothetical protein